ncbi:hypothetical protein PG984_008038 [Apiospora sp. TS-2023a]
MSSNTRHNARIPNEKWEAHREDIVRQFLVHNHSLDDIVEALKSSSFIVTKNQLSHRLNKTWRIRKKTTKGKSEPLWAYIDYQVAERLKDGKASHVILDGIILDPDTTNKQTGRYSQRAWSSGIGVRPKTPPGRLISVCTPREIASQTEWPQDLPWLISSVQSLQITSSVWHSSANQSLISKWKDSALLEVLGQLIPYNGSCQSSASFSIPIPESDEHGSIRLLKVMRSGNTREALQEQLKLVFLQASNKCLFTEYRWAQKEWSVFLNLIRLLNAVGLTQRPMNPSGDLTMLAARENLFQQTFHSLARTDRRPFDFIGLPQEDDMRCIADFLEWLLRSGQDPNVPVTCPQGDLTSALQYALTYRYDNLAAILLRHKANPCGRVPDYHININCGVHIPPLLLAVALGRASNNDSLVREIEKHENMLEQFLFPTKLHSSCGCGYSYLWKTGVYLPDKSHPAYEIVCTLGDELNSLAVLQYIKERVGSVWFETQEQGEGLLFHASRRGYLKILDFVLENNVDINATNQYGGTALHNAVLGYKSPYKTCKYLLERGAGLNSSCADISTFHLACSRVDDVEILKLLYSRGAIVNTSIDPKATSARFMKANRRLPYPPTEQGLVDHLSKCSTPLKAAITNNNLDPHELVEFLSQVAPNGTEVTDWMLESANVELFLLAMRSGNWRDLQLSNNQELLGWRGSCLMPVSLLAPEMQYVPNLHAPDLNSGGEVSFLEAIILWCPENALEAAASSRYDAGALCAAVFQVCKSSSELDSVISLLINRGLCHYATLDVSMETAALGIALYNDKIDLLDALQNDIPARHLARVPDVSAYGIEDAMSDPLWWHEPKRIGSFACFAVKSETCKFEDKVKRYGWDTVCLGMVVDSDDYEKIQVLMNHKLLRQNLTTDRGSYPIYPLDFCPLMESVVADDVKLVQACLKLGESVNATCPFSYVNDHTCLNEAVVQGNLNIVNLLLEWNADVNQNGRCRDQGNWDPMCTPLQLACAEGHLTIAKRLIDYGADINAVDDDDNTVLELAAARGSIDTIQLLFSKGARVGDPEGRNILDSAKLAALEGGHMVAVSLLEAHARKYGQYDESEDEDDEVESNDVGGDGDLEGEDEDYEGNDGYDTDEEHGGDEGYDEFVSSILNLG